VPLQGLDWLRLWKYVRKMKFDITWQEERETKKAVVEAVSSDEAVRMLAAELGHAPGVTYDVEPEDDLGYMERITLEDEP